MGTKTNLQVNQAQGWRLGLKNLLSRENSKWWGTSRWWTQSLIWALITNGVLLLLLFLLPFITATFEGVNPDDLEDIPDGITAFFSLAGISMPIGVVILLQGSIIDEKALGTAEWVLSKPVSRTAFVVSKLVAHTIGILVTYVLLQSTIAYGLISLNQNKLISLGGFIKGAGLLALLLFFYLALTLMLEVLFDKRGTVLGVALGAALGSALLVNLFPGLAFITPFAFPNMIPAIVQGLVPINFQILLPLISTFVMSLIFLAVAIWRFNNKAL
jgi:ABC-2 type transport system permease protein